MIGMNLHHKPTDTKGTVDAEIIHPDGTAMVRICDRWFEAQSLVPVTA
jgi:hypothetical protein